MSSRFIQSNVKKPFGIGCRMLSSRERLQERQGQYAPPRHVYLQQLMEEFQRSPHLIRKEEIVANLANFAYDPINYRSLDRLRVMDFFLNIMNAEKVGKASMNYNFQSKQGKAKTLSSDTSHRYKLVEFALGGICNCIPDPDLQQQFIEGDGVEIVAPYILKFSLESELTSAPELNVIVYALTIAYFLLDSNAFIEITSNKFTTKLQSLQSHRIEQIANTAAAFISRYQELAQINTYM